MGCCDSKIEPASEQNTVRGCTDIFWLCLYICFWSLMVLIAAFSFVYGSPVRLINGYDSFGNTCGKQYNQIRGDLKLSGLNTEDKSYLFFMDIKDLKKTLKICVKKCPSRKMNTLDELKAFYMETGSNLCRYDFNFTILNNKDIKSASSGTLGPCPILPVYDSKPILNRCVPRKVEGIATTVLSNFYELLNSWDTLEQILGDLYNTWKEILCLALLAFVISLFTISILHLLAALVSYIVMILVSISTVAGTAFLWYTYFDIKYSLDKIPRETLLTESIKNETAFLWYSIIATIFTSIILILVIVMRKQVDFLAKLFKETSKCLAAIPGLFLQPIATFVVLLGFFAFWIFVVLCLATAYYPGTKGLTFKDVEGFSTDVSKNSNLEPLNNISFFNPKIFTFVEYVDPMWVKYMWWVYLIGLIWTSEFIMACQSMVIAGSVAHWYYRHQYKDNSHVSYSISKLINYHLGSMALGSLLITLFKVPRLILTYLHTKLKKSENAAGECIKCTMRCCICCFWCLEKFIRYLNHNAYTVIAIDGVGFCSAAKTAFEVLTSHSLQVATINSVGDFILFLGKVFVTAVTGCIGLYFFRQNSKLTFYAAPTLIVCVFAFFIAHCLLSLYEMVLDTLYLCMCQNNEEEVRENIQLENMIPPPVPANNGQTTEMTQMNEEENEKL